MHKPRVLFILKLRQTSSGEGYTLLKNSGLKNSATFVNQMLIDSGYESKLVQVVDNNCIDREVKSFKPEIGIIEALWVVPEKFEVLTKLYPKVKWIIRLHSDLPFLANEGIALEWIVKSVKYKNVFVSANSDSVQRDLKKYLAAIPGGKYDQKIVFLPNYYKLDCKKLMPYQSTCSNIINVGCFGAIRPMKNHLVQAAAAVEYAESKNLKCRFHINGGRVEGLGAPVLKNLRSFFDGLGDKHELVEHGWLEKEDFMKLIDTMNFGMQVSFSETFNIVTADFVNQNVPIVTSKEVDWMPLIFTTDPTNTASVIRGIKRILFFHKWFNFIDISRLKLQSYARRSKLIWLANLPKVYYT
jgi:hypothetical protein